MYVNRWKSLGSARLAAPAPGYQPFVARDVRMYGFIFQGVEARLNDLCTRYLNEPMQGQFQYSPMPPHWVVLTFTETRSLAPKNPPFADLGCAPEREAAFWIWVHRSDGQSAPVSFSPYIFVDNPIAIIQGREIYGFPKEIGWFEGFRAPDKARCG